MTEPEYSRNIILTLANIQDFLRKPMLTMRMTEFFNLPESDRTEIISSAMSVGPDIPFLNFEKLFKTWLQVLTTLSEEQRHEMFFRYLSNISNKPVGAIKFNLDGLAGIFLSLDEQSKQILCTSLKNVIQTFPSPQRKIIKTLTPDIISVYLNI